MKTIEGFTQAPWYYSEDTGDILAEPWGEGAGQHEIALSVDTPQNGELIAQAPTLYARVQEALDKMPLAARIEMWKRDIAEHLSDAERNLFFQDMDDVIAARDALEGGDIRAMRSEITRIRARVQELEAVVRTDVAVMQEHVEGDGSEMCAFAEALEDARAALSEGGAE